MRRANNIIGTIAISKIKGVGPAFIKKYVSSETFESSNYAQSLKNVLQKANKLCAEDQILQEIEKAKETIELCYEDNETVVDINDENYPPQLRDLNDPPPVIFCKGNLELLYSSTIGIIGTRKPNGAGTSIAHRIGRYFIEKGWTICNGLAEGVDAFAVQASERSQGRILAVLAGGLNYNARRTLLIGTAERAEQVLQAGGLLISECPPDAREDTYSVIDSCRIQAALSDGLILVQSSTNGGSKFAVKSFCQTSKPIGIVQPIKQDYELESYSANKAIIEKRAEGILTFTGVKAEKVRTETIFVIKSKEDYTAFERIVAEQKLKRTDSPSLFG